MIAGAAGVSRQVVYRVQDDPAKAEAMLAEWGFVVVSTHGRGLKARTWFVESSTAFLQPKTAFASSLAFEGP